jgi:hypothetical protein
MQIGLCLDRPQADKKFWEELIAYFSLVRHGLHRKRKNYGRDTDTEQGDLLSLQ